MLKEPAGCDDDEVLRLFERRECNSQEGTAKYIVTFESTWSEETHPDDFPPSPHFSGLVGGTYNSEVTFWEEGELASAGIEAMAELGAKTPLRMEVEEAISADKAGAVLSGGGVNPSPGIASFMFEVTRDFPLVTLVSMLAPSPDWYVGVSSLSLCVNDRWVESKVVELYVYDAGTDSGTSYTSLDEDTNPPQPISRIESSPFVVGETIPPVGTFTFTKR